MVDGTCSITYLDKNTEKNTEKWWSSWEKTFEIMTQRNKKQKK
jgi:hypothetical protein